MRAIFASAFIALFASAALAADEPLPPPTGFLFWTPAQQALGYRNIEKIFPIRIIKAGGKVFDLPTATSATPFDVHYDLHGTASDTAAFMQANNVSGLLIIKDGKIVLERYGLGRKASDRWTSFSVAKSLTSTLIGAAIQDGYIKSLDAPVTDYIPGLKGSAYDGVTIRNMLTMTSGVKWNEDYADRNSDVNKFTQGTVGPNGENPIVTYMAKLPRESAPGAKWVYNTGETDLLGIMLANAIKRHPADYLSDKIWSKFAMEQDAVWMLDQAGEEIGGCCISMTLRDYGRLGMFMLGGARVGGAAIVPADYLALATKNEVPNPDNYAGYGYQWWTHTNGSYQAIGVFGQSIYINPAENLVVVINSAWPVAGAQKYYLAEAFYTNAVEKALHKG
jgi:CubicO group peptidase (beta-lactamase class C family)